MNGSTRVFSLLVVNKPGVLFRVTNHFRRRNFNIESVAVGPTGDPGLSKITVTMSADEVSADLFVRLLRRTIDVVEVEALSTAGVLMKELALVRVGAPPSDERQDFEGVVRGFGATVLSGSGDTVVVELSAHPERVDAFLTGLSRWGIRDVSRTGAVAIR